MGRFQESESTRASESVRSISQVLLDIATNQHRIEERLDRIERNVATLHAALAIADLQSKLDRLAPLAEIAEIAMTHPMVKMLAAQKLPAGMVPVK